MKLKTLILTAVLNLPMLAFAGHASGNPFAGIFVGAGLGYTNLTGTVGPAGDSRDVGHGGFEGQVVGGYNFAFSSNWLVGLEAYHSVGAVKEAQGKHVVTMSPVYGVDALLDYRFNQETIAFGGLGFAQGKASLVAPNNLNLNRTFNGWRGLVGLQEGLTESFSLRESIAYIDFNSQVIHSLPVKPAEFTGMFSLIYTFNS